MNSKSVWYRRTTYSTSKRWLLLLLCGLSAMLFTACSPTKSAPTTIAFAPGQMAPPTSVAANSTTQFAAVVTNDPQNLGVSWLLTCASPTVADCGSISHHTASGVAATYIAPISAPPGGSVTIEANSSADPAQSVTATITITPIVYGPISVVFSPPPPSSIVTNTLTGIFVIVNNDHLGSNGQPMGYTLSVTCAVAGTCGSVFGSTYGSTYYSSPATVPANGTVTFTATSVADPTQSATVTVTITLPAVAIALAQIPPGSISAGVATNLSATVTDGTVVSPLGVDWSATCGSTACGSFIPQHTASGVVTSYTAPSVVPSGGTVTLTATATADSTQQVSATLTVTSVTLNNSVLNGQYAFLLRGVQVEGASALAGSIIADGNGNITAGEESLPGQTPLVSGIVGSYFIGSDGRGTMTLSGLPGYGYGGWLNGQQMFSLAAVDSTHVFMEEFDGTGHYNINSNPSVSPWYGSTLRGDLLLQQPADFSVPPAGAYAFAWTHGGPTSSATPYAAYYGGVLNTDGAGNLTSFYMDRYIDGITGSIVSGIYGPQTFGTVDSFGCGTVNVGPYSLNYFVVDSEHIIVLASSSSDLTGFPAGHMYSQSSSAASLAGTYMFALAGSTPINSANGAAAVGSSPQAIGGWVTSDSNGNVSVGYLDTNNNGTVESAPVTGTLAPSAVSGRLTLTLSGGGASQFAAYPTASHGLLMFQLDTKKSGIGTALVQAVPVPTFQGNYSGSVQQLGLVTSTRNSQTVGLPMGAWSDISGQIIATSSSAITGSLDIDQVNGLFLGPSGNFWAQTPSASLTGGFTAGAQGRLTGSLTTNQLGTVGVILYVVDDSTVLLLEGDAVPAVGVLQLQNF